MRYFNDELNQIEKWKDLRLKLFRNEEPEVRLIGLTTPVQEIAQEGVTTETLPAFTGRESHESTGTHADDLELNRKLVKWGHHTPLEAVQFVYHIGGVSKSLAGQWTRHRIGIGWTFRSTRYVKASKNSFVYPALEYIDDENSVREIYDAYDMEHQHAMQTYTRLASLGVRNQELRRLMPVGWATSAYVYTNARALRQFFALRLKKSAEWEIRRLAYLMFNDAATRCPTLFEDMLGG